MHPNRLRMSVVIRRSAGAEDARKLRAARLAISTRKQQPAYGFEGLATLTGRLEYETVWVNGGRGIH